MARLTFDRRYAFDCVIPYRAIEAIRLTQYGRQFYTKTLADMDELRALIRPKPRLTIIQGGRT